MTCAFCEENLLTNRIIIENDLARAFPTQTQIVPGHILIVPKRHVQYFEECTKEERDAIEELRMKIKKVLTAIFDAQGFNYAWNEELIGGQTVPHFHLHVVPRKEGDAGIYEYEPRKFLYRPGSRAATPDEELAQLATQIREAL